MSIVRLIVRKLLNFLVHKEQYSILVLLVLLNIKEKNKGKEKRLFSSSLDKITVLALDCDKYRGDLEALSLHEGIRILFMSQKPAGWLVKPFYSELDIVRYINAKKDTDDAINHKKAYNFMRKFLSIFYKYVSVDCVTTVNYRYPEDYNWTKASDNLGVPHIMLYRECLIASERVYDRVTLRKSEQFGKFHGSHIITHNKICKQSFVDSGYVSSNKVSVAGALRMDNFIKLIEQNKAKKQQIKKKKFILFYFPHNINLFGENESVELKLPDKYSYHNKIWEKRDELFEDLHNAIIELALEYPDIEFIIKPKNVMVQNKSWNFYKGVVKNSEVNVKNLPNYKVDEDLNVSEAIIDSSIICALQSSVVLESALANKRVIFPLFYDFLDTPYSNDFFWINDIELFDVATSKSHFKKVFKNILCVSAPIPVNIQDKRIKLFEKWFDNVNGESLSLYYDTFKKVIN
jgi:hypothetical protein